MMRLAGRPARLVLPDICTLTIAACGDPSPRQQMHMMWHDASRGDLEQYRRHFAAVSILEIQK